MDGSSLLTETLQRFGGGAFMTIAVVTFLLCEAIFATMPIERAKMKQLTAVITGGVLGLLLHTMPTLTDSIIQGILAGGTTTITVAKFKKPSTTVAPVVIEPLPPPIPTPVTVAVEEPVEHL